MTQPGIFRIILRDERVDKLFTASDALHNKLEGVRKERRKKGEENANPTVHDIEETHLLHLRGTYRPFVAVACEYVRVSHSGAGTSIGQEGGHIEFRFPTHAHFTSDMVFHVRFANVGTQSPTASSPRFRFVSYPGIRLFKQVSFLSGGNLIDDYVRDEVSFINKFEIGQNRRLGWDRGMGEQELRRAESFNRNGYTTCMFYKEGMQTPAFFHGNNDLWVPAHFWFCKDAGQALCNDLIPNTQRVIKVELAPLHEMLGAFDQTTGAALPNSIPANLDLQIDLYVNNIFTNPEVYDIFASRVGFSLVRVHRRQHKMLSTESRDILLDQLKYPAEFMYLGVRDRSNVTNLDHWHLFGRQKARTESNSLLVPDFCWDGDLEACELVCSHALEKSTLEPIIETLTVTAHGINLYPTLPHTFFNSYLPQRYFNCTDIVTPEDNSAWLISFCLYPGKFNPSGYYNLSGARELYLKYTAPLITPQSQAELVVTMSALNFLIRRGDSCALKYAL